MKKSNQVAKWLSGGVALAMCVTIVGCGGGDDDGGGGGGTPAPTRTATATTAPGQATATPVVSNPTPTRTPASGATNTPSTGGPLTGSAAVQAFAAGLTTLVEFGNTASGSAEGTAAQIVLPPITADCTPSGTVTTSCVATGTGSDTTLTFHDCHSVNDAGDALIDGTVVQSTSKSCFTPVTEGDTFSSAIDADIDATSATGVHTVGTFDVTVGITLTGGGGSESTVNGTADTDCAGATTIVTVEPIVVVGGADCPTAGKVRVTFSDGTSLVTYTATGGIEIDLGDDGSVDETFDSCDDTGLAACPA